MGRSNRLLAIELPGKLLQIREALGLSQTQMATRLNTGKIKVYPSSISLWENGRREPPLPVLLRYARLVNLCVDLLADDESDLPKKLPLKKPHDPYS